MPQRRHASEVWDFSAGFHPAFIRLIRLNRFREQCSLENRSDTNIFRIFRMKKIGLENFKGVFVLCIFILVWFN